MSRNRQETILLDWLKMLPEELVRERPVLCNVYAGVLMQTGQMEGVEGWLRAAEHWLELTKASGDTGQAVPAGMGMTIGSVFGRIAGSEAARHARN